MKHLSAFATLTLIGLVGMPALAQSRTDRVNQLTSTISRSVDDKNQVYTDAQTGETVVRATPRQLLRETMTNVDYDAMPGRLALEVWSSQTGVPLVINWAALEQAGVDPETPITLTLKKVPAQQVLKLIVQQINPDPIGDDALIIDVEEWYVRVMTKRDALRQSTTRMYFIGDLLMTIPNFTDAPGFDLNDALSNTSTGGSSGGTTGGGGGNNGGGGGIFDTDRNTQQAEREPSKEEKAEKIADVIRNSIEPDIWVENGGEYASIRYFRGMLVVKAPEFVHEQIGVPFDGGTSTTTASSSSNGGYKTENTDKTRQYQRSRSTSGGVAATRSTGARTVR